jgi:hypothetical protein
MLTNAGIDDRLPPAIRKELERQLADQGILQDAEERGRIDARNRQQSKLSKAIVPLAAQQPMMVDGVAYVDMVPEWQMLEQDYDTVEYLPGIGQPIECSWWPFKPKGAETAVRRRFGPKAWELLIDGVFCLRCRGRYLEPNPVEGCHRCGLTQLHRERAMSYLERVASAMAGEGLVHVEGQSREARRAMRRKALKASGARTSGLILPSGVRV